MAKFYYMMIKADRITINDVPSRWREQTKELLDQ